MNQTAKPTGSPFHSAISQNSRGLPPNSAASIVGFGGLDLVQQFLVFGEFANQRQDKSRFAGTRAADDEGHSIAHTATHTATWALMCGCGS